MNYEWLDPILGYVGSLTQRLDAAVKEKRSYSAIESLNSVFGHVLEARHDRHTGNWWRHMLILDVSCNQGVIDCPSKKKVLWLPMVTWFLLHEQVRLLSWAGSIALTPMLSLHRTLFIPTLSNNLLFVGQVTEQLECIVLLFPSFCLL